MDITLSKKRMQAVIRVLQEHAEDDPDIKGALIDIEIQVVNK